MLVKTILAVMTGVIEMFAINEVVLYGGTGVCQITDITEKKFSNKCCQYYVLKPIFQKNSTVFVPVNNDSLVHKFKRVLSSDEVYDLIDLMPKAQSIWIDDESARKNYYKSIISDGDRGDLIRLIKTLYLRKQDLTLKGKKLHVSDEKFLKFAEKLLYDEFAMVLNIEQEQVVPFIRDQISSRCSET